MNPSFFAMTDFTLGLYYKLHGRHRPSGMKKGEIKRRKRVMPAMTSQPMLSSPFDSVDSPDVGAGGSSPQMSLPLHDRHRAGHVMEPQYRSFGPPPVDFTSYANSPLSTSLAAYATAGRKRTLGEIDASPQLPHLPVAPAGSAAIVPTSSTPGDQYRRSPDVAIDPSLAAFANAAANAANAVGGAESREQTRARLMEERERMRQSLAAVDMELSRMEDR